MNSNLYTEAEMIKLACSLVVSGALVMATIPTAFSMQMPSAPSVSSTPVIDVQAPPFRRPPPGGRPGPRPDRHSHGNAAAIGLGLGMLGIIAGAAAARQAAPPPPPPGAMWDNHVRWCMGRYRSYDIGSNTFQPYGGPRQVCVSPYWR